MVIKRTIETLKERPRDERLAFSALSAMAIMALLLVAWGWFFFRDMGRSVPAVTEGTASVVAPNSKEQAAAAAASIKSIIDATVTSDIGAQIPADTDDVVSEAENPASTTDVPGIGALSELQAALQQQ
ncbi:hypothetical protein FJY93_02285 [Candidatus Kaiserbacteria bacterium]|nr:hypothetical protein [Candidatus Kaiserbacteria bacterium]